MVIKRTTSVLCDICGKTAKRRARIGWVGKSSRIVDLCDQHAKALDDVLAAAEEHHPSRQSISKLPVVRDPGDIVKPDTPTRRPETAPGAKKMPPRSIGEATGRTPHRRDASVVG